MTITLHKWWLIVLLVLMCALALFLQACATPVSAVRASAPAAAAVCASCVTLTDGATVTVDVDVARGGAIVSAHALDAGEISPEMVDNTSPTGRQWQAAFWDGPCAAVSDSALCAGATNCLNPTQGGDACERRSGGTVLAAENRHAVTVRSQPRDFAASDRRPLELETTTALVAAGVVRLDYRVTNTSQYVFGSDAWQNLPVLFTPAEYSIARLGEQFVSIHLETVVDDAWKQSQQPEYLSRSSAEGWTVLLYVPGQHPWSIGFPGAQSPGAGWMQGLQWLELAPGAKGDATAWIVVGRTLEQARQRMGAIV